MKGQVVSSLVNYSVHGFKRPVHIYRTVPVRHSEYKEYVRTGMEFYVNQYDLFGKGNFGYWFGRTISGLKAKIRFENGFKGDRFVWTKEDQPAHNGR